MTYRDKPNWIVFAFLVLLALSTTACFEGEEACLDASARNFDVTADTNCSDCCTYPDLGLNFTHKIYLPDDTLNLEYQQPYPNNLGQYFAIGQITYYLSEVKLLDRFGDPIEVEDRIDIPFLDGGDTTFVETVDNFALVKPEVFSTFNIGTLIYSVELTALQFTVGIPEFIQASSPNLFDEDHPLAERDPAMYDQDTDRYLHNRISLRRDTLPDTPGQVIQITDEEQQVTVTLPLDVTAPSGFSTLIRLEVDYLRWFADVDFQNDDQETIKNKIVANLANSFRILSINFSS